jgi:Cof subfamily protein (haloacid dehalogenase superfamily)
MTIRLIAIDVDGTLLDDQHQLSERNARAIRAATSAGIPVILATGRMRNSCEWLIDALALQTDGIFVQGLYIADHTGKRIYGDYLEKAVLQHFAPFAEENNLSYVAFADNQIFTTRRDHYTDIILDYNEPEPIVVKNIADYPIHKLIILDDPSRIQQLRPPLALHMGKQADVLITQPEMVEIMPPGTSKGHSLRWLALRLGVSMADVLAIGNAENDLTMLQMAGLGVAVANAAQVVLDSADFITASNNDDGVADALERFVLA